MSVAESRECVRDRGGEGAVVSISAGTFLDAAVDGLMSCAGDGWRLIETDWMAEASSLAGLEDMVWLLFVHNNKRDIASVNGDGEKASLNSCLVSQVLPSRFRHTWSAPGKVNLSVES